MQDVSQSQEPRSGGGVAVLFLMILIVVVVAATGACSSAVSGSGYSQSAGAGAGVAGDAVAQSSTPASAQEYLATAKRHGKVYTPKVGSKVRKKLLAAARKALHTRSKFVVHSLHVQGDVAWGTVEPYPSGSGSQSNLTWVYWRKAWTVVDPTDGAAADTQSSASAYTQPAPTYQGQSSSAPQNYGDANGDGDSGVLWPSVPAGANPSPDSTGKNTEWHWVNGYYRSNGTWVDGYWRRTE